MKIKLLLATLVSLLPFWQVRLFFYRLFPGYDIADGVRIGHFARISVQTFVCGPKVIIGRNTRFKGPMIAEIGEGVYIGRDNFFECGDVTVRPEKAYMNYTRTLKVGKDCLISEDHFFDIYGTVAIGEGTWVAGRSSQFWTHGASAQDRDIHIGSKCYIGSAVGFAPGSSIGDRVVVGMGAVVPGKVDLSDVLLGGVPAKVLRKRDPEGDGLTFSRWDT